MFQRARGVSNAQHPSTRQIELRLPELLKSVVRISLRVHSNLYTDGESQGANPANRSCRCCRACKAAGSFSPSARRLLRVELHGQAPERYQAEYLSETSVSQ